MTSASEGRDAILATAEDMDFLRRHTEIYIASGGTRGHIINLKPFGGPERTPTLLLSTIGRKSGAARITPLAYGLHGGRWIVVGSNAGAATDPAWILNMRADPEVRFQIATQAFRGKAHFLEGAERDAVWAYMRTTTPQFDSYGAFGEREFPIVALEAVEDIAVFSPQ